MPPLIGQALTYDGKTPPSPEVENTFVRNCYWSDAGERIIQNGSKGLADLATWQKLSRQDKESRFIDPWASREQMPQWFRDRFHFQKDQFRPAGEVWEKYIAGKVRRSIAQVVLAGRLMRSKAIDEANFTDPDIAGVYFEFEGKRCLSLWAKRAGVKYFLAAGVAGATLENKFLQRKPLPVESQWVRLPLSEDPVTLIGVGQQIKEDRSLAIDVSRWTEPGKPIDARFTLENSGQSDQAYDLAIEVGDGWTVSEQIIKKTLAAGEKSNVPVRLRPPPEAKSGVFQLTVGGTVGGRQVSQSTMFGIGGSKAIKCSGHLSVDGDLSAWGPPTGVCDSKEQVVYGAEDWKGASDLSAKVWLRWNPDRELFFAADVADDQIVTNHRGDDPTKSDSVVLCVDARASWKQYLKDYTLGAFRIVMVPGDGNSPATARFEGQPFGEIVKAASRRTPKGYTIAVQVHFRSNLVEEPGWAANREIRAARWSTTRMIPTEAAARPRWGYGGQPPTPCRIVPR